MDAPERVEIGEETSYSFTVANVGGQDGTFDTTVSTRVGGTGQWSTSDPWSNTIPASGEVTFESQSFSSDFMETVAVRIDAFDRVFTIQFVSKQLAFGEPYTNPVSVTMSVTDVEFAGSYRWSTSGYDYTEEPPSGRKWAFAYVWAQNDGGQPEYLPFDQDFVIIADNSQYDAEFYRKQSGVYEGGEVQPGVRRQGEILYAVPSNLSRSDLQVVYSEQTVSGSVAAYWSEGGE